MLLLLFRNNGGAPVGPTVNLPNGQRAVFLRAEAAEKRLPVISGGRPESINTIRPANVGGNRR